METTGTEKNLVNHGIKEEMITGSVRDTEKGKPRYDLIPDSVITKLALLYMKGAELYGADNWKKGQPISRYISSMERHMRYWKMGIVDEEHLIQMIWNAFSIDWTLDAIKHGYLPEELDDRNIMMKPNKISDDLKNQIDDGIRNRINKNG